MRFPARMLLCLVSPWWVPASIWAQAPPDPIEPELVAEQPTRYRIEVIFFGYQERDPTEEFLELAPHQSHFHPRPELPALRYVDQATLRSIERQVDGPIEATGVDGVLPPFSEQLLAIDYFDEGIDARVRLLDPTELELSGEYATLDRLGAYTPLFHGGWEQDGLSDEDAVDLDITRIGSTNPIGTIRLHVSRFLHARVDLAYRPPITALNAVPDAFIPPRGGFRPFGADSFVTAPPPEPVYYLYEERRLFRGEINYLDHPAFGVILRVTLAPEPKPAAPGDGITPSA